MSPVDPTDGEGGRGGAKSCEGEQAWSSVNCSVLSGVHGYHNYLSTCFTSPYMYSTSRHSMSNATFTTLLPVQALILTTTSPNDHVISITCPNVHMTGAKDL